MSCVNEVKQNHFIVQIYFVMNSFNRNVKTQSGSMCGGSQIKPNIVREGVSALYGTQDKLSCVYK